MNYRCAFILGIIASLLFDAYQIYAISNNMLLSTIAWISFFIAIYGLFLNAISSESFEFEWMKYYLIPAALIMFAQLSTMDDIYSKIGDISDIEIERMVPGKASDYISSYKTTLLSYLIPFLFVLFYLVYEIGEKTVTYIKKL